MVFEEIGQAYDDVRFTREEWFGGVKKEYAEKGISPFGQVPIVSVGEHQHMAQTNAIYRHFAKLHNLYGDDALAQYECDLIIDGVEDWRRYVLLLLLFFFYFKK